PACAAALTDAAALLADLGHDLSEIPPPWREPELFDAFLTVWQVGPALYPVNDTALLTSLNRELAERAARASAASYAQAVVRLQAFARRVVAFWQQIDVVLTPTLALPPVPIGWQDEASGAVEQLLRSVAFTPFTAIANLTGLPAASLPLGETDDGLPVGVQALGPPAGDALPLPP